MAATQDDKSGSDRLIETIQDAEKASLDAVRNFVDTVNDAFPDLGDDGPRRKIIDEAFSMTHQLVGASNRLAQNVFDTSVKALDDAVPKKASSDD